MVYFYHFVLVFSSPGPNVHVKYFHQFESIISIVVCIC